MLVGLHLRNFALTERVELELHGGFTVITGETGAGKSVLIQAISFALGSTADSEMIRPGADSAEVEAVFQLDGADVFSAVANVMADADIPFDGELIVRRTIEQPRNDSQRISGRLRLNDRAASVAVLRDLAPLLADIHGQREHLSLLRPMEQMQLLDRFAGVEQERTAFSEQARRLRDLDAQLREFATGNRERARRIALLRHESSEIAAAGLVADEEADLQQQHVRLANAQQLAADASSALTALSSDVLGEALTAVRRIAEIDASAEPALDLLDGASEQTAEAVRELRGYLDEVQVDPRRLSEIEARLALIGDMKRRYGDTLADVIAYGGQAAAEAERLEQAAANVDAQAAEASELAAQLAEAAASLSQRRSYAARHLSAAVREECEALRLVGAQVEVQFAPLSATEGDRTLTVAGEERGFDSNGIDRVEILVSFNPDSPPRPLRRVASGGETARLTLAIKAVLGESDVVPLMVFDEVDVGLGGRSGSMIGERLARLGEQRQVICITHLPQVAARAREHIVVAKSAVRTPRGVQTQVDARMLSRSERVEELADMLGGASEANRASAADLLHAAVAS